MQRRVASGARQAAISARRTAPPVAVAVAVAPGGSWSDLAHCSLCAVIVAMGKFLALW